MKRIEQLGQDKPATGRRHPVCRLVLPRDAAIGLINQLEKLGGALEQQGVLKRAQPAEAAKKDQPAAGKKLNA